MEPLFSVIVPVYNTEEYLDRCIKSILEQSFTNFELILINDGSTDRSGSICDAYSRSDSRIKVIHQENKGLVASRKAGLKISTGRYVSYIDSDDWIDNNAYEELSSILDEHDVQLVDCFFVKEYNGVQAVRKTAIPEGVYSKEKLEKELGRIIHEEPPFRYAINSSLCTKIIKREFLEQFQYGIDESILIGEDFAVSLQMFSHLDKVYFCNKPYYHYCVREKSMSYDDRSIDFDIYRNMAVFMLGRIGHSGTVFFDYLLYRLFDLLLDYFLAVPDDYLNFREEFPFFRGVKRGDSVVVYGKGLQANNIIKVSQKTGFLNVIINADSSDIDEKIDDIKKSEYDHILIAIADGGISSQIKDNLVGYGIEESKIKTLDRSFFVPDNLPDGIRNMIKEG